MYTRTSATTGPCSSSYSYFQTGSSSAAGGVGGVGVGGHGNYPSYSAGGGSGAVGSTSTYNHQYNVAVGGAAAGGGGVNPTAADDHSQCTATNNALLRGGYCRCCNMASCQSSISATWAKIKGRCLLPISDVFLGSAYWRAFLLFGNFVLLFGSPIQMLLIPKAADPAFDVLYTVVFVTFIVDIIFRAAAVPGYFGIDSHRIFQPSSSSSSCSNRILLCCCPRRGLCWPTMGSFLFWCDFFSTLTLLYDISYINPTNFDMVEINIDLRNLLTMSQQAIASINQAQPWEMNLSILLAVVKTARVVRFVRSQAVSNLISKVNWYWPLQRLNDLWNTFACCCSTPQRWRDVGDGEDETVHNGTGANPGGVNGNYTNNNGSNLGGNSKLRDTSHRHHYRGGGGDADMASSKTSSHAAAAAAAVEEYQNRQGSSWDGLGLATLAAAKAQRLSQASELERQNTWSGKLKYLLRKCGILGKDHAEWQRQLAATKIQRAWRRAVARQAGQSDFFRDELGMLPKMKSLKPGSVGEHKAWASSSLTKKSSSNTKSLSRSLRKMSIYPGMDAAAAATARISQKLKYAAGGDSAAESQVGGAMRELTGQRVAIGILVALFLTATFTYVETDATRPATMVILHTQTTGTSISQDGRTIITRPPPQKWILTALDAARRSSVPDLYQFDASLINGTQETYQFNVEENQDLRNREKLRVTIESYNRTDPNYATMTSVGWFAYRQERKNEALVQLYSTIFILFLWLFGVTAFAGPVMVLVVLPIERMVRLLGMLMVDPLGYQSTSRYRCFVAEEDQMSKNTRWSKEVLKGMETSFLMSTILRIGSLMKVGFGSAGVEIIRKNLEKKQGGMVNLQTSKGVTVSCIFLFCDIRQFTDATECLQEEVFVFTNRIAAVVHSHCHSFGGSANKNVGDAFLCSWLLDEPPNDHGFGGEDQLYAKSNQADKCLMCVVKIIMALHHDSYYIETMSEAPRQRLLAKLKKRPGPVVQMGCGIHAGKAVQGAIGSERKIDATYVSEAVDLSEFLESSTKKYGLKMLMSNSFYNLLHSNNRQRCRLVDQIVMNSDNEDEDDPATMYERDDILELYTFDMDIDALWKAPVAPTQKQPSSSKDPMEGSMSDADSKQGISDRRSELKKVLSGTRPPGSTRMGRNGRRLSTMLNNNKSAVNSSGTSPMIPKLSISMDGSQHDTLGGHEHNSGALKLPDQKESAQEFRKPELILPTGPALYTPAMWRTETMFRIRKKYLDGLFFHNYSQGLQSYYHREWDRAKQSFQAILDSFEDGPSRYFLTQMEAAGGKPPPNFRPYGYA